MGVGGHDIPLVPRITKNVADPTDCARVAPPCVRVQGKKRAHKLLIVIPDAGRHALPSPLTHTADGDTYAIFAHHTNLARYQSL
jgi:hypothetical protein